MFTKLGTWPNQSAVKYSAPKLVPQIDFTHASQSSLFSFRLIALVMLSINQHTPPPCVHTLVKAALGERKRALVASNVGLALSGWKVTLLGASVEVCGDSASMR